VIAAEAISRLRIYMERFEWYALHVRPRFEKVVAGCLQEYQIENYLPLRRLTRQSAASMGSIELPLLPGYIFCKVPPSVLRSLITIPGVLDVAGDAHSNSAISEEKIRDFRRIIDVGLTVQPWPFTRSEKTVMIENGPLKGVSGILEDTPAARVLIVSIDLIQRSVAVKVGLSSHILVGYRCGHCGLGGTDDSHHSFHLCRVPLLRLRFHYHP
jgi:transcription antitermination factor NusG